MAFIDNIECNVRVWIHQYAGGGGWAECIDAGAYEVIPAAHEHPGNIQVTSVRAFCPPGS
jgi:hypothetical protein